MKKKLGVRGRDRREKQQMQGSKETEGRLAKGKAVPAWVSPPGVPLVEGLLAVNGERSVPQPDPCGEPQKREAAVPQRLGSASPGSPAYSWPKHPFSSGSKCP